MEGNEKRIQRKDGRMKVREEMVQGTRNGGKKKRKAKWREERKKGKKERTKERILGSLELQF